ncbi:cupin domain-containing protein [Jeotgalibaca sp. A122]|uniref:cupin domain-containing protein n=1 Tax=Jeotgalibaca sp. A122 TaxID=3457322 RepID=UPI003FD22F2E
MLVDTLYFEENYPFPNNHLPLLHYQGALKDVLGDISDSSEVLDLFANNKYTNGWVNGIYKRHHFHSNAHEVLGCISGIAEVEFGGPQGNVVTFSKGDVVLIPAGVSHKLLKQTDDFSIVGAYPDNQIHDMQYGDAPNYDYIKNNIERTPLPKLDPIQGETGAVREYW